MRIQEVLAYYIIPIRMLSFRGHYGPHYASCPFVCLSVCPSVPFLTKEQTSRSNDVKISRKYQIIERPS